MNNQQGSNKVLRGNQNKTINFCELALYAKQSYNIATKQLNKLLGSKGENLREMQGSLRHHDYM